MNLYDVVSQTKQGSLDVKADFDQTKRISKNNDPFFIYSGQVDTDNKRSGFGRYISLFNGSVYEGHCLKGQQNGFGRLICRPKNNTESILYYIGYWKEGLRHGKGKQVSSPSGQVQQGLWNKNELVSGITE